MSGRSRKALPALVGFVLTLSSAISAQAFTPTYAIKRCSATRIKPRTFTILRNCYADSGIYARRSVWRYWDRKMLGDRWAKARTRIYINNCVPDCADGHFHHRAARVWLTGRRWCKSVHRHVYTVQHIKYRGPDFGIGPDIRRWPRGWHVLGCPPSFP